MTEGNRMLSRLLAVAVVALSSGCSGPLPFMSGGAISGEDQSAPSDWALEEDYGLVVLETRPDDPYSINIAYLQLGGRLYIYAGDTETQWVQNMDADPNVRLLLGDVIYGLRADRVLDADEISAFGEIWKDKSIFHRDPTDLDELWLYQLSAR